jgi:hypothetical protein
MVNVTIDESSVKDLPGILGLLYELGLPKRKTVIELDWNQVMLEKNPINFIKVWDLNNLLFHSQLNYDLT